MVLARLEFNKHFLIKLHSAASAKPLNVLGHREMIPGLNLSAGAAERGEQGRTWAPLLESEIQGTLRALGLEAKA